MNIRARLLRLATRPHLPRRTVRLRLTLLYGVLFLVSGAVLLTITYGLVRNATDGVDVYHGSNGMAGAVIDPPHQSKKSPAVVSTQSDNDPATNLTPAQAQAQAQRLASLAKRQHDDQLDALLTQSGIALGIMTIISLVLGWYIAGRVLRPIRRITRSAREISATNLHERLALDGPDDELKELGDTVDQLLARLERAFEAQRRFVANASHELRTPLARQRTVAQVALSDPEATVASLRAAHERVLTAGEQQERLIDGLLTLTRGQAGLARHEPLDLRTTTETITREHASGARERSLHVTATLEPASTLGDPRLVERLVTNLIDNALRHNHPGGRVEIATRTSNGHAILSVSNDGPPIPPSELPRLFEPLQRLDPARFSHPDGHGLGLSIVQAIADAHNASINTRARPQGGLTIEVQFPALANNKGQSAHTRTHATRRDDHLVAATP
jgi:signal transduction histidine kinase